MEASVPHHSEHPEGALLEGDAPATLAAAAEVVRRRRLVEVEDLQVLAHWAGLHSADPTEGPDSAVQRRIGNVLKQLGGDGTPGVQDFCLGEIAMARGTGVTATTNALADVLDLKYRLPNVWSILHTGRAEVWVARKIAKLSRHPPAAGIWVVDDAVARIIATEPGGRVIEVAEAKIIEADPTLHESRREAELRRRYVTRGRLDEHGLRTMIARLDAADAHWVDHTVTRVAEILRDQATKRGEDTLPSPEGGTVEISIDEWRARAFAMLAKPAELLTLLLQNPQPGDNSHPATAFPQALLDALRDADLSVLRPKATLYVHLNPHSQVARVEGLGPVLTNHLRHLLGCTDLAIKPVLDLSLRVKTSAYEHPESLKERVRLTANGDYWPYGATLALSPDYDHPHPLQPRWPTRANRHPQLRPPHQTTPPLENPRPLPIPTKRTRPIHLDHPQRTRLRRRPTRHQTHPPPTRPHDPQRRGRSRPLPLLRSRFDGTHGSYPQSYPPLWRITAV